jgi:hypothetical protein
MNRSRRHLLEVWGLIWLCVLMAAALYFRGPSGTTFADVLATKVFPVPPPATWLQTNGGVLIQAMGTMIAGIAASIAAYFGMKNHALTTQIHVDTDGRLTTMANLLNAQATDAKELARLVSEAILAATEKTKAATLAASTKATADIKDAAAAASTNVNMPGAEVTGRIPLTEK